MPTPTTSVTSATLCVLAWKTDRVIACAEAQYCFICKNQISRRLRNGKRAHLTCWDEYCKLHTGGGNQQHADEAMEDEDEEMEQPAPPDAAAAAAANVLAAYAQPVAAVMQQPPPVDEYRA
jgi:hypothetical protein